MKKALFILLVMHVCTPLSAQDEEECLYTLRRAEELYDQGLIEDIPSMLQPCIQQGFSREDRLRAYKLVILSYLYDDNKEKAEAEMLGFLRRYPEYELLPTDPVEFSYLFNSYDTRHKFTYGVFFGGNMTHGLISEPYGVYDLAGEKPEYRFLSPGITAGARLNFLLGNQYELCVESHFSTHTFSYEHTGPLLGFAQLDHEESQSWVNLPISVTRDFSFNRLGLFIRAGFQSAYLLNAKVDINRKYTGTTDVAFNEVTGPGLDISSLRKSINVWVLAGGGLKYKISRGYVIFDVRYNIGLMNQNGDSQNRYTGNEDIQDLNFYYYYTDSDFRMNHLVFSIGYLRSVYNPKKK